MGAWLAAAGGPAYSWIALAALLLSALTFVSTQFGSRRTATASYVAQLERRVEDLEKDLVEERERSRGLVAENIELLRRLARLDNH